MEKLDEHFRVRRYVIPDTFITVDIKITYDVVQADGEAFSHGRGQKDRGAHRVVPPGTPQRVSEAVVRTQSQQCGHWC